MRGSFSQRRRLFGALAVTAVAVVAAVYATGVGSAASSKCVRFALVESAVTGTPLASDNLDPDGLYSTYAWNIAYNRLGQPDASFNVKPQLATSWNSNKAATVWTFNLRKGVKFHNGKELTSADVVWTFKHFWADEKTYGSGPLTLLKKFLKPDGISAKDKYTVVFKPFLPTPELPYYVSSKPMYIVQQGATAQSMATKDAGTGPFTVDQFTPGKFPYRFKKFSGYFEPGLPKANCVEFYLVQEEGSRAASLQSGQIDVVQALGSSTIPQLKSDPKIKLNAGPPGLALNLYMQTDMPPFNDVRVRRAIKKVLDRQRLVKTLLLGYGTVGDDNPVPPTSAYAWRKTVPPQDIAGAKKLLTAAGYGPSNPLKVDLYTAEALPNMLQLAQAIAQDAAKAGIQINVITTPASEYWDKVYRQHSFGSSGWNPRPPGEALALEFSDNRADDPLGNETHFYSKAFDAYVAKARSTVDPAQRAALYRKALKTVTLWGGDIRPLFVRTVAGMRANCSGYTVALTFSQIEALKNTSCN